MCWSGGLDGVLLVWNAALPVRLKGGVVHRDGGRFGGAFFADGGSVADAGEVVELHERPIQEPEVVARSGMWEARRPGSQRTSSPAWRLGALMACS